MAAAMGAVMAVDTSVWAPMSAGAFMSTGAFMSAGAFTSAGTFTLTEPFAPIGPYTGVTLSAESTMATFGTGTGGISGMAVGMHTASAHAGFTLTACGSGIFSPVRFEVVRRASRNAARPLSRAD